MGDGRVGLHEDVVVLAERGKLEGGVADMREQLVDRRLHLAMVQDVLQIALQEVGHADGAQLAGGQGVLQRAVGLDVTRLVAVIGLVDLDPRLWGVDDHHVQVVESRHLQRLVDRGGRSAVGLVLRCHL